MSFVGLMRNVPGVMVVKVTQQFFPRGRRSSDDGLYPKPAITGVVTDHALRAKCFRPAPRSMGRRAQRHLPHPRLHRRLTRASPRATATKPVYAACLLAGALGVQLYGLCCCTTSTR